MANDENSSIIQAARQLLSGRLEGVLATQSLDHPPFPFGSVLPYSLGPDGWPLLLLSHLAKHTRNLDNAPECSLTVVEPGNGDVQRRMRLTCLAMAEPVLDVDPGLARRHFRYFPDSRDYFEQLNFRFYRLQPQRLYCVGGFGAARWIGVDRLQAANPFAFRAEEDALGRINETLADRLHRHLASLQPISDPAPVTAIGLDSQGLDLRQEDRLYRVPFATTAATPEEAIDLAADALLT